MRAVIVLFLALSLTEAKQFTELRDVQWKNFKANYGKTYPTEEQQLHRRLIFEDNMDFIEKHNEEYERGARTFSLGVNQFADLTNKEFRARHNGYRGRKTPSQNVFDSSKVKVEDLPASVDWRTEGYVTDVKNQGQCGSCWAFSTTGSLEGAHFKATGKLVSLSEQNLVDCSQAEGNEGCNGGLMDSAFEYIKKNNGIDTEDSYPYTAEDDKCKFSSNGIGATLSAWTDIKTGDETALQQAVATVGPVSVAIDASSIFFQFYFGGVFWLPWCSSTELDHGVLAVGYGATSSGNPYWIVKNSWGASWGEYGYIRMQRNDKNMCGIATNASFPLI